MLAHVITHQDKIWRPATALVLKSRLPMETIQLIAEAWPDAVREKDDDGWLPLHYACLYGYSDDVIQLLIECWPMSLHVKTEGGILPLHLALQPEAKLEAIQMLVHAWPEAVHEHDKDGRLPLHCACEKGCADDVIQFLAHSWLESCQVPTTTEGDLPLHLACRHQSSAVILFLLNFYPQAVRFENKKLQLPLHIACTRESVLGLEVIAHLVRAWPESIQIACPYACD